MNKWVVRWHDDWNGGPHYWSQKFSNELQALNYALKIYESGNGWVDVEIYKYDGKIWTSTSKKNRKRNKTPWWFFLIAVCVSVALHIFIK